MTTEETKEPPPMFKLNLDEKIIGATGKPMETSQSIQDIIEELNKIVASTEPLTKGMLKKAAEKLHTLTMRDALQMLLGQSTDITLKETYTLRECVFQISGEIPEIELSVKRLELLRKLAKSNTGPQGKILVPLIQGQVLTALGYTSEDDL
jgi:hypothetical protein